MSRTCIHHSRLYGYCRWANGSLPAKSSLTLEQSRHFMDNPPEERRAPQADRQ